MKAFAIIGAILFAWISGVGASVSGEAREQREYKRADHVAIGAMLLLVFAILCGIWAWRL